MIKTEIKLAWPYRMLLLAVAIGLFIVWLGPRGAMRYLGRSVEDNDAAALAHMINAPLLRETAKKIIEAELRLHWQADQAKHPAMAAQDYLTGKHGLDQQAVALTSPSGFPSFLRGDFGHADTGDLPASATWISEAELHWLSPTTVKAELVNPVNGWHTRLILTREGLFNWHVRDIVLPVEEMLAQFVSELKPSGQEPATAPQNCPKKDRNPASI